MIRYRKQAIMSQSDPDVTRTAPRQALSVPHSQMDEGRFPPGSILAQRYRIVSLLGRGGMGEVYRANDLLIGQAVALKFLPEAWARDESVTSRFRNEVRTARMVTHPNVCRVHDLGEAEGRIFLSMEFIDGEDLAGLLRRIGRLPEDKGLEAARKLCAGLQAAHEKNVLHRDLKPANVMIDGRGEVLITDFGLAGIAGSIQDPRSGTPAYMAPEQREGREVSVRSDIYSLGMVLHELFTGKRPDDSRTSASGLDPAIGAVIDRCLSADPVDRPASALAVARALPGGDPLAAALAAGATPSPEVVAASGEKAGLKPAAAIPLLAIALLGPILVAWAFDHSRPVAPLSPEELRVRARDLVKQSEGGLPTYEAAGFERAQVADAPGNGERLMGPHRFWYRASPAPFGEFRTSNSLRLRPRDPPLETEGMVLVMFDAQSGRLVHYERVPRRGEPPPASGPDWQPLLRMAGAGLSKLEKLSEAPGMAAWSLQDEAGIRYRITATAIAGRLSEFRVAANTESSQAGSRWPWIIESVLTALAVYFAWRNWKAGRADMNGAISLMKIGGLAATLAFLLRGGDLLHWNSAVTPVDALGPPLMIALLLGFGYAAMEPHVRRHWPRFLVTWVRLLRGNWRDPVVGRDVLLGMAASAFTASCWAIGSLATGRQSALDQAPFEHLQSTPFFLASMIGGITISIFRAVTASFLLFLLRLLLRNEWLAMAGWMLAFSVLVRAEIQASSPFAYAAVLVVAAVQVGLLVRFGFLAKAASEVMVLSIGTVSTLDATNWFATYSFIRLAVTAALVLTAYRVATAGSRAVAEE